MPEAVLPTTMRALRVIAPGKASLTEVPVPILEDNEILVKTSYTALNPSDYVLINILKISGVNIGTDFSGHVIALGPNLKNTIFKVGDKIASFHLGAHADYVKVESDLAFHVTEAGGVDLDTACQMATFGTAAQILYAKQSVPYPPKKISSEQWHFINGGSTNVGQYAVQLATLAGYKVIATASPKNFDYVKARGAAVVLDYRDPDLLTKVQEITGGELPLCIDCSAKNDSFELCLKAVSKGGRVNVVHGVPEPIAKLAAEQDKTVQASTAFSLLGKAMEMDHFSIDVIPEDRDLMVKLCQDMPKFLGEYGIRLNGMRDVGGLEDILPSLDVLWNGGVSAEKLRIKVAA